MTLTATPNAPPANLAKNKLLMNCYEEMLSQQLILPTIPEISYKIRRAVSDSNASSHKIARVIQADPAITARLIQIANSPFYCGRKKIESCPEALTRLGLPASLDIVTSMAIKSVFRANTESVRKKMSALWAHSTSISAISAVLAHKIHGFDPDRAMLAGLIHDIGIVPILTYADKHPEILAQPTDLVETVKHLRVDIGIQIIRNWAFPPDFEEVVQHSESWFRNTPQKTNYADLVMIAQLLSYIGKVDAKKMPHIDTLPVYKKMSKYLDITDSISILHEAKEEIEQIHKLLS